MKRLPLADVILIENYSHSYLMTINTSEYDLGFFYLRCLFYASFAALTAAW